MATTNVTVHHHNARTGILVTPGLALVALPLILLAIYTWVVAVGIVVLVTAGVYAMKSGRWGGLVLGLVALAAIVAVGLSTR